MQETVLVLNRILWDLNTESLTRTAPVNQSHSSSCQSLPQPLAQPRTPTRSAAVRSWNGILTSHTANYSPPEGHTRSGAEQVLRISDGSERSAPALRTARSGSEGLAHSASHLHRFSTPGTPLTRRRFLDAAEARSSALCRNGAAATDSRPSHGQVHSHGPPEPPEPPQKRTLSRAEPRSAQHPGQPERSAAGRAAPPAASPAPYLSGAAGGGAQRYAAQRRWPEKRATEALLAARGAEGSCGQRAAGQCGQPQRAQAQQAEHRGTAGRAGAQT